ncbi:MAG: DUF5671 domain-containing protein [Acidimicrobiia bacterium]
MGSSVVILLGLLAVILVVVTVVQRSAGKRTDTGEGSDVIAYLVLALAMGVSGFALAELMDTAFPGDRFVFDPADSVATSLASLVVSLPFVVFLWRRQARRRSLFPESSGWTLYLAIIELVFMTAFVVSAVAFVNGLFTDGSASAWARALVFGGIVLFHELAARSTPPLSDSGELQRVVGSAIGLITGGLGVVGTLSAVFGSLFDSSQFRFEPWVAMIVVGVPLWAYRWLRSWDREPALPRHTWLVLTTTISLVGAIASVTWVLVLVLQYLFTDTPPAADHFDLIPVPLAVAITATPVWWVHRRALGGARTNPVRLYEYVMAGTGLVTGALAAIGLTIVALDQSLIVGGQSDDVVALATVLVVGLVVWRVFTALSSRGIPEEEATSWPSKFYHLGLGIVFALAASASLIATLFIVLRRLLGQEATSSLLEPITVLVYTGLATWYLLSGYARIRRMTESEEVVTPFEVTLITSHPGMIATLFPKQARIQVIYRGDGAGQIDDDMAEAIVAEVGTRSSIVWVDEEGFRVAPKAGTL